MPDSSPMPEKSNALDVTVSELSGKLKRTVEDTFGHVRVRGEISGYRGPHSSGHSYFSLKDDRARLEAVIWRGVASKLKHLPEEGLEVVASGKLTTYPGSSKYQIVIDNLEPAGAGALMALLEERRRKLAADGLFADEAKQPLPFMPKVIGVVTSPTGAVIRDVLHRIADRFPVHVIVWPVRVQGETSGREVANGIHQLNNLPLDGAIPRPDVIIVARGGGSMEDLWGFNDEVVVRATAASRIPLISAVGHETDWTLIDHAADHRAPTPTAAAERAVPVKADLEAYLADLGARLRGAVSRSVQQRRERARAAARALPSLDTLLAVPRRDFDEAAGRLRRALSARVVRAGDRLAATARRNDIRLVAQVSARKRDALKTQALRHGRALQEPVSRKRSALDRMLPRLSAEGRRTIDIRRNALGLAAQKLRLAPLQNAVSTARLNLDRQADDLARNIARQADRNRQRLDRSERLLSTLGYRNVLARGYAVIRDENADVVRDLAKLPAGSRVEVETHKIKRSAVLEGPSAAKPAPKPKRKAQPAAASQGDLF